MCWYWLISVFVCGCMGGAGVFVLVNSVLVCRRISVLGDKLLISLTVRDATGAGCRPSPSYRSGVYSATQVSSNQGAVLCQW